MATIKENTVYFSTRRRSYANNSIIGIDPELNLYKGYDGDLDECTDRQYLL